MQQIGHIIADGTAVARNGIATGTSAPVDRVAASAYVTVYIQSRTTAAPLLSRLPVSLLLPPNLTYPTLLPPPSPVHICIYVERAILTFVLNIFLTFIPALHMYI
jgi:hypothetical protein